MFGYKIFLSEMPRKIIIDTVIQCNSFWLFAFQNGFDLFLFLNVFFFNSNSPMAFLVYEREIKTEHAHKL